LPGQPIAEAINAKCIRSQISSREVPIRAELIGSNTCSALGVVAHGHGPMLRLCRLLVDAWHDPAVPLEAWRGSVLCLRVRSIGEAAKLTVRESTRDGRPRFEALRSDVGPPVRQKRAGGPHDSTAA
jgi:hypothetical protein